ncbi:hypothetical protein CUC15_04940 [Oceanobacillus zhaokaii]|uniref:Uncharacterized protein n=1 Tax=Oceanobacillus zhaokaii TaxID=2052660 RepID=A0A345PE86_9BACI|nr:hypothetical protein CUC15_04940 [Oceanobacillus zhaokaii]
MSINQALFYFGNNLREIIVALITLGLILLVGVYYGEKNGEQDQTGAEVLKIFRLKMASDIHFYLVY